MKNPFYVYVALVLTCLFLACGSRGELKYLDVNYHRTYQDTTIGSAKTYTQRIVAVRRVINEYLDLNYLGKDTSSFYFYLLGRAYYKGTEPLNVVVFDTVSQKLLDSNFYKVCVDSALYYVEKSLKCDLANVMSMYTLARLLRNDRYYFSELSKEKISIPTSYSRSPGLFTKRVNFILNHALNYEDLDTSYKKIRARYIIETALLWLSADIKGFKYSDLDNPQMLASLLMMDQYVNYLEKYSDDEINTINQDYFTDIKNRLAPLVKEYNRRQNEIAEQKYIASVDLKHKYSYVSNDKYVVDVLDLWTEEDFTQVGKVVGDDLIIHGRGKYTRDGSKIYFSSTDGETFNGQAKISLYNNIIYITLPNGWRYIQDDDERYIKNGISTNR